MKEGDIVKIIKDGRRYVWGCKAKCSPVGKTGVIVAASEHYAHVRACDTNGKQMGSGTDGFFFIQAKKTSLELQKVKIE